jgi:hypothetical protein
MQEHATKATKATIIGDSDGECERNSALCHRDY